MLSGLFQRTSLLHISGSGVCCIAAARENLELLLLLLRPMNLHEEICQHVGVLFVFTKKKKEIFYQNTLYTV